MWDRLVVGDASSMLRSYPENSVHCVVTSPPYWTQRDHGCGIGNEDTIDGYLDALTDVFSQCYRVLREDGSLMLNIGDVYVDKERQLLPFKLADRLSDDIGFSIRQDLVWSKSHTKPDPADDRRSVSHEYVFHLTVGNDYWYDGSVTGGGHASVIEAPTATTDNSHTAVFSEEFIEKTLTGIAPPVVCENCGQPYDREYERVPRPLSDTDRAQSIRAREIYEESELTEDHIRAVRAAGISDVGQAAETEDGAGRNTDEVNRLASEAKDVLGGYYREFTMVEKRQTGWEKRCVCPHGSNGGVVCDPFVGSGTTCSVASGMGYRYLGIDVNKSFIREARQRLPAAPEGAASGGGR